MRRGERIGGYELQSRIAEGGMGEVWRARHDSQAVRQQQGEAVAIKILHAQYSRNKPFRERFRREADIGTRLRHPNIVRTLGLIDQGDNLGLVMELVEGTPLSELIGQQKGPIPWQKTLPLFQQLLAAVEYAHSEGVIHRDLKPANVMVRPDNHVVVLDFGIAKLADSRMTKTGTGMGTVDYMAPEQYTRAHAIDQRADIYALGMTLYEMVGGRLPWPAGTTEFDVQKQKVQGSLPAPTDFYPYIPRHAVRAILRALQAEPDARFANVGELRAALETEDEGDALPVSMPTPPQLRAVVGQVAPRSLPVPNPMPPVPTPRPQPAVQATPGWHGPMIWINLVFTLMLGLAFLALLGSVGSLSDKTSGLRSQMNSEVLRVKPVVITKDKTGAEICRAQGRKCVFVSVTPISVRDKYAGHSLFDCNTRMEPRSSCESGYAMSERAFEPDPSSEVHTVVQSWRASYMCVSEGKFSYAYCQLGP